MEKKNAIACKLNSHHSDSHQKKKYFSHLGTEKHCKLLLLF